MIPLQRYKLEFILHTYDTTIETIKNSLVEFGESLEVSDSSGSEGKGDNFQISLNTEDPTLVFDICSQFGRIRSVKINDEGN
jgi:dihydroxyacetone kinase-like predicted kinase